MSAMPCGCDPEANHQCGNFPACVYGSLIEAPEVSPDTTEVRATADSGGQKGRKLARFALMPYDALWAVAEHFGRGAEKYEDRNWERGYPWSWCADALQRHFAAWWQGEDRDAETGSLHITAVVWHALVLLAFSLRGRGLDDRPKQE